MKLLLLSFALFAAACSQFSENAQEAILKIHNDLRSAVALGGYEVQGVEHPAAANMIKMRWSPASAKTAQAYANTCSDGESGQANVGENIYLDWSQKNPSSLDKYGINAAVSWSEQFSYFGWSSTYLDEETLESGIKDATQMVWAKTGYVGCGVKNCGPDPQTYTQAYKIMVVCHYRAMGNVLDEEIYEEGESCSNCPAYRVCEDETGLCA